MYVIHKSTRRYCKYTKDPPKINAFIKYGLKEKYRFKGNVNTPKISKILKGIEKNKNLKHM
jgi:hypothetical protein